MPATRFRKIPVVIEAHQWFNNGDHPHDGPADREGRVVRLFRRPEPEYESSKAHKMCGRTWHDHGWIDTLEGGHTVCPGDWIITGVQGERYPCKADIFAQTYEPVDVCPAPDPDIGLTVAELLDQHIIAARDTGLARADRSLGRAPLLGDTVWYRDKHGIHAVLAATVTATKGSLDPLGVAADHVPALTDKTHVHLWVHTPSDTGGFPAYNVPAAPEHSELSPGEWRPRPAP
jgi:hypothetical protein